MKIETLSVTQIQVTLNHSDLLDRNLKISELAYSSKTAQALFKDMMARAYEDFGFETANVPDRKSTRLNSSHSPLYRMPSSA